MRKPGRSRYAATRAPPATAGDGKTNDGTGRQGLLPVRSRHEKSPLSFGGSGLNPIQGELEETDLTIPRLFTFVLVLIVITLYECVMSTDSWCLTPALAARVLAPERPSRFAAVLH
jgi:hypothetical protein